MKSYAVLGLGQFGFSVAQTIAKGDFELICVDKFSDKIQAVSKFVPHAVIADCTDEQTLRDLGINNCDVVVVAIGHEFETALLTTVTLKEMGVKKVVVKALNERNANILYKVGADMVILPEMEMGVRVANAITESDIIDRINLSPDYSIIELQVPQKWVSKTVEQIDIRKKCGITIIAIKRGDEIIVSPLATETFEKHDICVLLGADEILENLKNS